MKQIKDYMISNIESHKEHFIEAFSHVYGQDCHEFIKERIDNTKILICHDNIDKYILYKMNYKISGHITPNKDKGEESVKYYMRLRKLYDEYNKHIYNELKKYFPTLKETNFPRSFIGYFESFNLRFGKDKSKNKSIMWSRIEYFKALGLNLGDNYEDYINNEEAKKLIPNTAQKKKFKEICHELYKKENQLRDIFSSNYLEIEEILEEEKYSRREVYHKDMKGENISYCILNTKNGYISPVCVFNILNLLDDSEMVYAHEFAHAISTSDPRKSGLYTKGKYRTLNEAIEDYSIIAVYEYMLEHNYTIFNKKPSIENKSIYRHIVPIGKEFVEKFKDSMNIFRFGSDEQLYKLVDPSFLEDLDTLCGAIVEETMRVYSGKEDYIKVLQSIAIKKIRGYIPNKKR